MNHAKSLTAAMLSVLLISSAAMPALAEAVPSEKEEVIYIMTDASGQVTDMEAVNIFSGGNITDYGEYTAVKPLNTTDTLTQNGDEITFSSNAEKVYYQGTMKHTSIPWDISIRYFLDGTAYPAETIAGKSGALEIRFTVSKNENCPGSFYENYALQAAFTLDTDRCKNISADGATIANVGNKKQISYTILPGKGIDAVIRADVTDFEMESAAINGVRLHLNVDIDDAQLTDKVDELVSAIGSIDSGASEVNSGIKTLSEATGTLNEKVGELYTGVGNLTSGADELSSGLVSITDKNGQLTDAAYAAYEGLCSAASVALNNQLAENRKDCVTLTPASYSAVLTQLLEEMDADAVYQQAYQAAMQQVTQQAEAQADALYEGYIRTQSDAILRQYTEKSLYEQAVYAQLLQNGYGADQANLYLQSAEGQAAVAQAAAGLTEEERAQLLGDALSQLTDGQKEQILQGALHALTEEQKQEILAASIQQIMTSDEVTAQINAAVASVSDAARQVSALKDQLDSYGDFYQGLLDYTGAVNDAAAGADTLRVNMDTLYSNTETLQASVGDLNDATGKLQDGTQALADGTAEFVTKTADMDTQISDEITTMTDSLTGSDSETVSFVSERNTNVTAVQFVIKTAAIEKAETAVNVVQEEAPLTFPQKLLRLFGLY